MNQRFLNALLWGNSVALSWMWGLGLFFSVQITFMFGLQGLLLFAIPNALGLMLFGYFTDRVAKKHGNSKESLANFFEKYSKPFNFAFYLYQIVALGLTVFALTQYFFGTVNWVDGQLHGMYLALAAFGLLAAGAFFGEELGIKKIKYGHAVAGGLIALCIGVVLWSMKGLGWEPLGFAPALATQADGQPAGGGPSLLGYTIPLLVGLLVGPWLDLQHWQRAIQIRRENTSVSLSYFLGGSIFFLLLLFHGTVAAWVLSKTSGTDLLALLQPGNTHEGIDGFTYAHQIGVEFAQSLQASGSWLPAAYFGFLILCALTTLDSGYVALKWFLSNTLAKSDNMLLAMVPKKALESPLPTFLVVALLTLAGLAAKLQLEYFMVMYASFFVGYAAIAIGRSFVPNAHRELPQIRLASVAFLSVVLFALGYFTTNTLILALATLLPLAHVAWLAATSDVFKAVAVTETDSPASAPALATPTPVAASSAPVATTTVATDASAVAHAVQGHFDGKWFVYQMMASYSDTNSVGNIYFGMYAMFVGKTRELFFNAVMPDFNLKTTNFYILTRSFEHKFVREAREFDLITVKIRVSETNRKFCTLQHQIYGPSGELLGKGQQSLLFVSSADYGLIDIPTEVMTAFMPHL